MKCRVEKEHSHAWFWVLLTLLSAMIFARYGLQIDIPRVLALVPIVAIALWGNPTEMIAICMCLIPLHESLDFYYALVLVAAIYGFKCRGTIRFNTSLVLLCLIVIWELLHCFTADFSPVGFVVSLAPMIALTVILSGDHSGLDYAFVIRATAAAAIVTCVTMLVQVAWISRFHLTAFLLNLRRLGNLSEASMDRLRLSGGMVQTNSLGIICVVITACLLQLRRAGVGRRGDRFLMMTLLMFGTLTASRTFLACLALMFLLVLWDQKGGFQKLRSLGMAVLAGGFIVLVFSIFFPDQLEYYISRFSEKDITTGRDDLMTAYHRFITRNPRVLLFGVGLQNYGDKLTTYYRIARNVPHNSIQEIVTAWGVPGLLLIGMLILQIVYRANRQKGPRELMNYIPLIILLFKSVAGQLLTSSYSMLALALAYLNLIQDIPEAPMPLKK